MRYRGWPPNGPRASDCRRRPGSRAIDLAGDRGDRRGPGEPQDPQRMRPGDVLRPQRPARRQPCRAGGHGPPALAGHADALLRLRRTPRSRDDGRWPGPPERPRDDGSPTQLRDRSGLPGAPGSARPSSCPWSPKRRGGPRRGRGSRSGALGIEGGEDFELVAIAARAFPHLSPGASGAFGSDVSGGCHRRARCGAGPTERRWRAPAGPSTQAGPQTPTTPRRSVGNVTGRLCRCRRTRFRRASRASSAGSSRTRAVCASRDRRYAPPCRSGSRAASFYSLRG